MISATAGIAGYNAPSQCCAYGAAATQGQGVLGYDCVEIPGAMNVAGIFVRSRICGRSFGLVTINAGTIATTVCCE